MSAGTIALTNNSASVTGSGTAFTADLKPNDFIVSIVGGVTYTLGIKSIESATALTLISNYGGPTASGQSWTAVPNATLVGITAQVASDVAKAIRGLNLDKANWQQVYSGSGNITVTLPDGSTFTGPSWNYLATTAATKVSGAVPINQGGTGATSAAAALSNLGAAPKASPTFTGAVTASTINLSGNASVLGSGQNIIFRIDATDIASISGSGIYTNSSVDARGCYKSRRGQGGDLGANYWSYFWDGSDIRAYVDTSNLGALAFKPASDALLKKEKVYQDTESYLSEVLEWRPATFKYIERGVIPESDTVLGFIANDLVKVSPECVTGEGLKEGFDPLNPEGAYGLDQIAMIAKLAGAIHAQQVQIDVLKKELMKLSQD